MLLDAFNLIAQTPTGQTNEQLELLLQGWVGMAMIAALGALGLIMIVALIAVWRRTLARQRRLEEQIHHLRSSVPAIGDAWAAAANRIPGPPPLGTIPDDDEEDDDDEDGEDDDPFNLFGGRDPLDRDGDEDEDDDFDDDEAPPPGF